MNVSELLRQLKVTKEEFLLGIKELGFDIGARAIQIDDRVAEKIIQRWEEVKDKIKIQEKVLEEIPVEAKEVKENKIFISDFITVHDLADKLKLSVVKIINELMKNSIMATINERIDFSTASIIAEDLGFKVEKGEELGEEENGLDLKKIFDSEDKTKLKPRPPVVIVVGHIDHGKTSLLDSIRETNVASKEAGAITQHMGAYQVEKRGRLITFLDTPGHEAFNTMRSRGGKVADIAVLVIAADDKIQPQTIESIKVIEQAKLPFVVAINKIDKPEADPERIKKELSELNLIPEDWGGKTICVLVSARTKTGLDDLLEMILLVADLEKDKILANPDRDAIGTVIESHLDKGEGPVATSIIHTGTLKVGDPVLISDSYGRIKALKNWQNKNVIEAGPGMPVKVLGLKGLPKMGDILEVVRDKKLLKKKIKDLPKGYKKELAEEKEVKGKKEMGILKVVLKTDFLGSQEAIIESLNKIKHADVAIKIIKKGLGSISDIDVVEAEAYQGKVLGFNVSITSGAEKMAQDTNIEVKSFKIIYELIDWVKEELTKLLKPEILKVTTGRLEVMAIFGEGIKYIIVGGRVKEGKIEKKRKVRILRNEKEIGEGFIVQLQSNKLAADEVNVGQDAGMKVEGFKEIKVGDILEVYKEEIIERKLEN